MAFEIRFERALPFGACAAVALPEDGAAFAWPAALTAGEAAHARGLPPARRATWIGGRVALRAALDRLRAAPAADILATPRGAPALPPGVSGSISHTRGVAVALAALAAPAARVGVDVERVRPLRFDVARRVLTPGERAALPDAPSPARDRQVMLRFAAKEAIYKALDPWLQRYVAFREVAIAAGPDARLTATFTAAAGEPPFVIELHDASDESLVLVAARARPVDR